MKKVWTSMLTVILTVTMILCSILPIYAAGKEEYLCELRLIYADDYEEAKEILSDSEFRGYKLLNENLNRDSGKIGVWLAYKTTTDIDDAITDIAVMQMNGGYQEGNYQAMIKESYAEYVQMGGVYRKAIQYFANAYDEDHFMAELAYRQLNLYTVESEGIPEEEIPDFEGELLGDIFLDEPTAEELATMFMEGNSYALRNIRALICMGVSYNEDGLTYMEKVGEEVEALTADPLLYAEKDYRDLAALISPTIIVFRDMFKELEVYEDEMNYEDEDITELEMEYLEYKAMAEMMRAVDYLDGKTLYEFCMEYKINEEDFSDLYPLVAALNEGQTAMTQVAHYYNVVRYSMHNEDTEEDLLDELELLEDEYEDEPFNIYTGVDRTIYRGTFALTSAADRANAFTEDGLMGALFAGEYQALNIAFGVTGCVGAGLMLGTIAYHIYTKWPAWQAMSAYKADLAARITSFGQWGSVSGMSGSSPDQVANLIISKMYQGNGYLKWTFEQKMNYLFQMRYDIPYGVGYEYNRLTAEYTKTIQENSVVKSNYRAAQEATDAAADSLAYIGVFYVIAGALMLASAIELGIMTLNYYYPDYDDIPAAMVDLIETVDGDRYIKYDVVLEAEEQKPGVYAAGDLNAFKGQRWNAIYYTKSYEAGKPLLADEFSLSTQSNTPKEGYAPVHRFGETVCYNLNKYNFKGETGLYLSVKQSKNDKSAVANVPQLVGSMMEAGYLALAGGIGVAVGIGGTLVTKNALKKKKDKATA